MNAEFDYDAATDSLYIKLRPGESVDNRIVGDDIVVDIGIDGEPRVARFDASGGYLFHYSAACFCSGSGRQRSTGLRAAAVSSRRRRGVRCGALQK